jgi:hypothetical protein
MPDKIWVTTNPELKRTEDPIQGSHDLKTTRESIKHLLKHGTPNWVRWPQDYKAMVKEQFAWEKEQSDTMVEQYKMAGQSILADKKSRMVNITTARDFVRRLRRNGVKCVTFNNPRMPQTVGLWCIKPGTDRLIYIAYMQVPCMYEWSVLRLDRHGLPNGEDFRGWRTVLSQLIVKGILSEKKAHKVFGHPSGHRSLIYRQTLFNYRNGIGRNLVAENSFLE